MCRVCDKCELLSAWAGREADGRSLSAIPERSTDRGRRLRWYDRNQQCIVKLGNNTTQV